MNFFNKKFLHYLLDKVFVIIGSLVVLLPTNPQNMPYSSRDSGVFLYIGWRILNGELPYRDIWDHKPPMIFYINALGLAITDNSRWGVWFLEFISLALATYIGYKIIQNAFGSKSAILSTWLWLLTLVFVIQGGNFTTEYTLPLQFAAVWLSIKTIERKNFSHWRWFLVGILGGIAFFTKQTAIGIWVSIVIFLIIFRFNSHRFKELVYELIYFLGGFFIICVGWVIYFGIQGGLLHFWNAAFEYNFIYSSTGMGFLSRLKPLYYGIVPLSRMGLLQFAGIGYLLGLLLFLYKRNKIQSWLPLLVIGLINLPIELILVSTSGRNYAHYYMTLLPVLTFFSGITFWIIISSRLLIDNPKPAQCLLTVGVVLIFFWPFYDQFTKLVISYQEVDRRRTIIESINEITTPEDKILLWGAASSINFDTRLRSPTRFVYQYPLYTKGYSNEKMILEFLEDIIKSRPKLIIDTYEKQTPLYEFPIQTDKIQVRIEQLRCLYQEIGDIPLANWTVYEYTSKDCIY